VKTLVVAIIVACLGTAGLAFGHGSSSKLPVPGQRYHAVTQATLGSTVCVSIGYTSTIRPPVSYTSALKRWLLKGPPALPARQATYELDHAIPYSSWVAPRIRRTWSGPQTQPLTTFATSSKPKARRRTPNEATISTLVAGLRWLGRDRGRLVLLCRLPVRSLVEMPPMRQSGKWAEVTPGVAWDGGEPTWHARDHWIKFGPMLVKYCLTKTGARFGAWRRGRRA
jgi:hypothetical protein